MQGTRLGEFSTGLASCDLNWPLEAKKGHHLFRFGKAHRLWVQKLWAFPDTRKQRACGSKSNVQITGLPHAGTKWGVVFLLGFLERNEREPSKKHLRRTQLTYDSQPMD